MVTKVGGNSGGIIAIQAHRTAIIDVQMSVAPATGHEGGREIGGRTVVVYLDGAAAAAVVTEDGTDTAAVIAGDAQRTAVGNIKDAFVAVAHDQRAILNEPFRAGIHNVYRAAGMPADVGGEVAAVDAGAVHKAPVLNRQIAGAAVTDDGRTIGNVQFGSRAVNCDKTQAVGMTAKDQTATLVIRATEGSQAAIGDGQIAGAVEAHIEGAIINRQLRIGRGNSGGHDHRLIKGAGCR